MWAKKVFHLVLIKPSHYDDKGYVIQWGRSAIPSNSLAVLNALSMDSADRKVLGPDIQIKVHLIDETNTLVFVNRIVRKIRRGIGGLVGFVGVQTNQFPRAVDLGSRFYQKGIPVVIGGFHVSGSIAMLKVVPVDIQAAMDKGLTLFAGEAEGHMDEILLDAFHKRLKPLYNYLSDNPPLEGVRPPLLPYRIVKKTFRRLASFDAGRGCPFQCSFCTIINVQGRTSRGRSADDIEALIRANGKQGIWRFFITDDDFARNRRWEEIVDRLIYLKEVEGLPISFTIQVDTLCHKIPRFIEKTVRAGCSNIFIGLETLNPQSLAESKKRQNKIVEYRRMFQAWQDHGCTTVAGYIIGFPHDTPESIVRDIDIIKRELPVDLVEFFCWTPLPGSEDHKNLVSQGVAMEPDMNCYDLEHVTTHHPNMTKQEWQQAYHMAWKQYYTDDHFETLMRRVAAKGTSPIQVMFFLLCFYGSITFHGVHPLEAGTCRLAVRSHRRPGLPIESLFTYYPRRFWKLVITSGKWVKFAWKLNRIRRCVVRDSYKQNYSDLAILPVSQSQEGDLDLMKTYGSLISIKKQSKPLPLSTSYKTSASS